MFILIFFLSSLPRRCIDLGEYNLLGFYQNRLLVGPDRAFCMAAKLDPLKLERGLAESEMEDEKIYFLEQFHPRGQKLD